MLTLDITPFRSGVHRVTLEPDPEAVDLAEDAFRNLVVSMHLQCQRDRILITMELQAEAHLTCDRTLEMFWHPIQNEYVVLFGPAHLAEADDEHEAYDEVRSMAPTDKELDLTDIVHDTLKLAIPQRVVAPGAEDAELQLQYGAPDEPEEDPTDDIDPRWEKLKQLRDDDTDDPAS